MSPQTYLLGVLGVMTAATLIDRVLPFALLAPFRRNAKLQFLGKSLPPAAMLLLLIYCLKDVSFSQAPYALPELAGILVTLFLHLWKRNALLSIGCGTGLYVYLIQR